MLFKRARFVTEKLKKMRTRTRGKTRETALARESRRKKKNEEQERKV